MNAQQAENRVNADIEFAVSIFFSKDHRKFQVIKAVEAYGFSTAGVKVDSAVKAD